MKYNTNYVEGQCFDFHRPPCGCDRPRPPHGNCGCENPVWNNPWFNPQFQQPCFQQPFPNFPCQPNFCQTFPQQCCAPSCGCLNFQIPLSFLYLYAGYMIGNSGKKC